MATWRRRSEPSRDPHMISGMDTTDGTESPSEWHDPKTDDETEESSGNRQADVTLPDSDLGSETCTPQRCPESLEHIVEQLVLQNVEIQRILQRQKRRAFRNTSVPRGGVRTGFFAASASAPEPVDEGIYDSLILSPALIPDGDGDYVSIRADENLPLTEEEAPPPPEEKSHFSRCQMRSIPHSGFFSFFFFSFFLAIWRGSLELIRFMMDFSGGR